MSALIVAGCSSSKAQPRANDPVPKKTSATKSAPELETGPGRSPFFAKNPRGESELRWEIAWKSAHLDPKSGAHDSAGLLREVTGRIAERGSTAATFSALTANGNAKTRRLRLEGEVVVVGAEVEATLRCGVIEYDSDAHTFHATGAVTVEDAFGTVGPLDEIWCNGDLSRVATTAEGLK